jgi:hypothetical protein
MKATSLTTCTLSVLHGLQVESSFDKHAVMIAEYLMVVEYLSDQPQNRVPASREKSTTREPKQTERRSLLQSGRRESRRKLSTRKPDFLQACSMPNVMARGRRSLRAFKQTSMSDVMEAPARKPASQRSLNGVSVRTSKSDSEPVKRRSSIGEFLEDDSRSRVKPCRMEAADATSTKAISKLPAHKWKVVSTSPHVTKPPAMPKKSSSQRCVVQNRKSGPRSGNVT